MYRNSVPVALAVILHRKKAERSSATRKKAERSSATRKKSGTEFRYTWVNSTKQNTDYTNQTRINQVFTKTNQNPCLIRTIRVPNNSCLILGFNQALGQHLARFERGPHKINAGGQFLERENSCIVERKGRKPYDSAV